jgi:2-succinyl-6-hydroxy-2,4-cyclohexadiene-1-carboxylate synthase
MIKKTLTIDGYTVRVVGDNLQKTGTPFVFLHGFLGSSAEFESAARYLTQPILRVNLLGYATSQLVAADSVTMAGQIAFLKKLLDQLALPKIVLVGYSMGGRVALGFALTHPNYVQQLVLESTTAGIPDANKRLDRQQLDRQRAQHIRDDFTGFVKMWAALPLFASQKQLTTEQQTHIHQQRLAQLPENMAVALEQLGTSVQPNFWPNLAQLTMPVRIVVGELDEKFVAIGQKMAERIPDSERIIISNAGHNTHLEQPAQFYAQLTTLG